MPITPTISKVNAMTARNWQQIKELFHSALECAPQERAAFLNETCRGDESLRSEVESLIAAHEREGSFIDSPAYEVAARWLADDGAESLVGQQISQYKILEQLGAGGMGEVYLAYDTKVGRKVALKMLPACYETDQREYQLHRFHQEARAVSSLNHPNIVTVHDIGQQSGRHFIVTELIEGQTLRGCLIDKRIELDEALDIILQAGSALAATHEVGIIHRDIKPDNIMLRRDGYVKVLDFGLAKLAERKSVRPKSEAPTLMPGNTSPGMVVGTINYMSPEQARGLDVDERTDIWSLGVVLYEMLSGSAPFKGETPTDVIVSILERDPSPLAALSEEIPAELDWIVKKALRKDRDERYQTVKEMLGDLRRAKQELEFEAKLERTATQDKSSGRVEAPPKRILESATTLTTNRSAVIPTDEIKEAQASNARPSVNKTKPYRTPITAALAVVGLVVIGFALYKIFIQKKTVASFQAMTITRLTNHGKAILAAISPDGKYFVYVLSDAGKQSLLLRQINSASEKEIIPPAALAYFGVTFSPDGTNLYYVTKLNDPGTLYRMPMLGGTPVKLLEGIDGPVSFSPDGKRLAFVRGDYPNAGESGLYIADVDGSNEQQIATRKLPDLFYPNAFAGPSWSPDGQSVACSLVTMGRGGRLIAVRVQDQKEEVLTTHFWPSIGRAEWLPDMSGLIMIARRRDSPDSQVWYLSYPVAEERPITNDLNNYRSLSFTADYSKFVTIQVSSRSNLWVAPNGDTSRAVSLSTGNVYTGSGDDTISWTPDGQMVYGASTNGVADVWIMDSDGNNRKQLTVGASARSPVVSPDGRYLVFVSFRDGTRKLWRVQMDGSNLKPLTRSLADFWPCFSPDGQWVIYSSFNAAGKITLWKVQTEGGTPVELTSNQAQMPSVSPDGKLIAYLYAEGDSTPLPSSDAPPNKMAVIPFDGGGPIKTFDIAQSGSVRTIMHWSNDGRALLYTVNNTNATNIWSQPLDGGKPVQVTNLTEGLITTFNYSRDGKMLAYTHGTLIRDAVLISNAK